MTQEETAELERVAQGLTPRLEDLAAQGAVLARIGRTSMVSAAPPGPLS